MSMNHSSMIEAVEAAGKRTPSNTVAGDEFEAQVKGDNEASHMMPGAEISPSETLDAARAAGMSDEQINKFMDKVENEANFNPGVEGERKEAYKYLQLNTYLKFDTLNGTENYKNFGAEGVAKIFAEAKNLALEGRAAELGQLVDQYGDRGQMTDQQLVDLYNVNEHSYNHFNGGGDDYFHWTHITALNYKPLDGSAANSLTGYNDGGGWGQWESGQEGNYNNLWDMATRLYANINQSVGRPFDEADLSNAPAPDFAPHPSVEPMGPGTGPTMDMPQSGDTHSSGGHGGSAGTSAPESNPIAPSNNDGSGGSAPNVTEPVGSRASPSGGSSADGSDMGGMDLSSLPPWLQQLIMDVLNQSKSDAASSGPQGPAAPTAQAPMAQGATQAAAVDPTTAGMSADTLTPALQGTGISAEQFTQQAQIEQGSSEIKSMIETAMQDGTMSDGERGAIGQALAEQTFASLGKSFDDLTPQNQLAIVEQLVGTESATAAQTGQDASAGTADLAEALEGSGISAQDFEQAATSQKSNTEIQGLLEAARSDGSFTELEQGVIGREMAENIFESMGKSLDSLSPLDQMAISGYCSNCLNADAGMAMDHIG
jgi:hypothetical protein